MNIPFEACLPIVALLAFMLTEYVPLGGRAKPIFLGALAAVCAIVATLVFDIEYGQSISAIMAVVGASWVNEIAKVANLKKGGQDNGRDAENDN